MSTGSERANGGDRSDVFTRSQAECDPRTPGNEGAGLLSSIIDART